VNLSCESHRKESSQRESGECGEIGIFGSVARNEHQAGSDLDVFVELQQDGIYA
jgi:predicted nucleotidyltransferase